MTDVEEVNSTERPKPSDPRLAEQKRALGFVAQEAGAVSSDPTAVPLFDLDRSGGILGLQEEFPYSDEQPLLVDQEIADEEAEVFSDKANTWLESVYGAEWWRVFGYERKAGVVPQVLAELLAQRINIISPNTPERMAALFSAWLKGESLQSLEEEYSVKVTTLRMALYNALGRIVANPSGPKLIRKRLGGKAVSHTVNQAPSIAPRQSRVADEILDRVVPPLTPEEQEGLTIAQIWAQRLGFNEAKTKGWQHFLNPNGSTILNRENMVPAQYFIDYVTHHYKGIDHEAFKFTDQQKTILRALFGAWHDPQERPKGTPLPQSMARYLQSQRTRGVKDEAVVGPVERALHTMLEVDTKRITERLADQA